ncbi:MAG: ribonuclease BN [Omnitrophica WOR_2 bacterium GWF2_38_59]|nr:MAG: ribonuclease BN [Omnitrophica WOR_2 bacterium GWA2_37_7]OGX26583.1 MAG: ribonuclease BN [Omnitrophica WOR_2 bacterium GWF2_38_59]OGX47708.1 MAG: ribonuclease BN [Omnitrophica WOR_2 bacterium RIFOXYA2_FULL_38_17]OGX51405.1 MAG: ribonuclease BN [Omnitrophica WOR_2 bacterium RIFOXYA12_FULL_38_10]OGX56679.1 MAG: ribonuclease BN [Omnitrophica WOR_2 bacterium RIFOXYB2_FULL_38_16]OGX57761.1 MAG: ribonuclease BN [Omnitrophica WOR_2 bacterium RIFOXYC2_FULL_38_12]HBG60412.1 YihY/virulence facto
MSLLNKLINFLKIDVWRIRTKNISKLRSFWITQLRIILLSIRGFAEDKCQLRASALTFYSLLSIVPVVAMAFGIAKGFGFEQILEKQLMTRFPGQESVVAQIIGFANSMLENTKGGVIAGIGIAILFWTVIKVLGNIENSFNDIWGIKKSRSLGRKFSDYLSIMLICPILLIMSSSMTVLITSQVKLVLSKISLLGTLSPIILILLQIMPYCVIWVLFTFIYIFMPNTKVNLKSGLFGGIIAGTIYQVVQWAYITFQVGVTKYGAIYGSFAALPLFLVWLQISWLIVLFGAEISFAEQNVETYEFEPDCLKASHSYKRLLTLRITQLCIKYFVEGKEPLNAKDFSNILEIPIRLVRDLLYDLSESGVLIEVKTSENKSSAYHPAIYLDQLTIKNVLNMLDERGINNIPVAESKELEVLKHSLNTFDEQNKSSKENWILKDI